MPAQLPGWGASTRGRLAVAGPWLLSALLMAPSALWVLRNRSVWSWDESHYGVGTVELWRALCLEPPSWPRLMSSVLYAKAPLLVWVGQLFVPLGDSVSSIETGLLLSVILSGGLLLWWTWDLARRVRPGSKSGAIAVVLFVGGSPLFVALSHHYLTEVIQALAVTYTLWVAARSTSWPALRTLLHLLLAVELGLLAKISTPAFVLFPLALAFARGFAAWRRTGLRRPQGKEWSLVALLGAITVLGVAWYSRNGGHTLQFARMSASSDMAALLWGRRGGPLEKLAFWTGSLWRGCLAPATGWVALGSVLAAALVLRLGRFRGGSTEKESPPPADRALLIAAALQLLLVFAILSRTVNQETRFLLEVMPTLGVLLAGGLPRGRRARAFSYGLGVALALQWGWVQAGTLGLVPRVDSSYWGGPPRVEPDKMGLVDRVVARTCDPASAGRNSLLGVDLDWFNGHTLTFYSAKRGLHGGPRCTYQYFGLAADDLNAVWSQLEKQDALYLIAFDPASHPILPTR